jgi:adenylosuccinate lyase
MNDTLFSISPVDGRYQSQTQSLRDYFSEFALIKYRVRIEIEYFIDLCQSGIPFLRTFPINEATDTLRKIYINFSEQDAIRIKEIEKTTNHDVKAVEYFLREEFNKNNWDAYVEYIHFGLTSQDINNTAIPLSLKEFLNKEYKALIEKVISKLNEQAEEWKDIVMLARTHGQAASPTRLGKEWMVFVERINNQLMLMNQLPVQAKFGGATGNFNAHHVAFPNINWVNFANDFIQRTGLERQQFTTQIEHYDMLGAHLDNIRRINTILIDFSRDVWMYVSDNYFTQKTKEGEVGSSAMPHKVNPIDFENAEGNLGIANALLTHLSEKLPVSRLQRDLTDSTVLRNLGVPLAHTVIAINSILKGLNKIVVNQSAINADLDANWAVVAEAIQTILRRENYPHPYEALRQLTRGNQTINEQSIKAFIAALDVSPQVKEELMAISPFNYSGV